MNKTKQHYDNLIIGFGCNDANEMINTIQIAMNAGLNYQLVRDAIDTHPSMTEAFNSLYSSFP